MLATYRNVNFMPKLPAGGPPFVGFSGLLIQYILSDPTRLETVFIVRHVTFVLSNG